MGGIRTSTLFGKLAGSLSSTSNRKPFLTKDNARENALKARRLLTEGMLVYVSKQSLDGLETLLGQRPNKQFMRKLIEAIANGTYQVVEANAPTAPTPTNGNGHATKETIYTLQQAAKFLGCHPQALYARARKGRITTVRDGSRWLMTQSEVSRLKDLGV